MTFNYCVYDNGRSFCGVSFIVLNPMLCCSLAERPATGPFTAGAGVGAGCLGINEILAANTALLLSNLQPRTSKNPSRPAAFEQSFHSLNTISYSKGSDGAAQPGCACKPNQSQRTTLKHAKAAVSLMSPT